MKSISVGLFVLSFSYGAQAMDLPEFLSGVLNKNKTAQSYEASTEAAQQRRVGSDIELVPVFTAGVSYLNDKSPLGQFAQLGASQTEAQNFQASLSKKFSTGTEVSLSATAAEIENSGSILLPEFSRFSYGTLGVALNQSIWKDAFGSGTRLRWQRLDASSAVSFSHQ